MLGDIFSLFKFGQPEQFSSVNITSGTRMLNQPILLRPPIQQKNLCWDDCTFGRVHEIKVPGSRNFLRIGNQTKWKLSAREWPTTFNWRKFSLAIIKCYTVCAQHWSHTRESEYHCLECIIYTNSAPGVLFWYLFFLGAQLNQGGTFIWKFMVITLFTSMSCFSFIFFRRRKSWC